MLIIKNTPDEVFNSISSPIEKVKSYIKVTESDLENIINNQNNKENYFNKTLPPPSFIVHTPSFEIYSNTFKKMACQKELKQGNYNIFYTKCETEYLMYKSLNNQLWVICFNRGKFIFSRDASYYS